MIPQTIEAWQTLSWQQELSAAVTDRQELLQLLELESDQLSQAQQACLDFPLRVPRPFLQRVRRGDPKDPLLLQILPVDSELASIPGFSADPLAEADSNPVPGIIHKYAGRLLMVVSPACAINCRYCFRRHFAYDDNNPGRQAWQNAIDYIARDQGIAEVIFSGGDPLAASDRQLLWLVRQIEAIDHVQRLRIHTRLPIVIPARIDEHCLGWLTGSRLQTVVVIHCNHANEIDPAVGIAIHKLRSAGINVLNQTVLLRGVNDSVPALQHLSEALFTMGVLPYYLHLPDPVAGTAHFSVPLERARELFRQLHALLPGYLVPRLVREVAGAQGKSLLC